MNEIVNGNEARTVNPYAAMAYGAIASGGRETMHGSEHPDFDIEKEYGNVIAVSPTVNHRDSDSKGSRYEVTSNGQATVRNRMVAPDNHPNDISAPKHVFSEKNQPKARELITSLATKQGQREVDRQRSEEVKRAKAYLGRNGLPIPKKK